MSASGTRISDPRGIAVQVQGQLQETFHPNAYAQRGLGTCLTLIAARTGNFACTNTPGAGTDAMVLSPAG